MIKDFMCTMMGPQWWAHNQVYPSKSFCEEAEDSPTILPERGLTRGSPPIYSSLRAPRMYCTSSKLLSIYCSYFFSLSLSLSISPSLHLSSSPFVHLAICPSIHLAIYLPTYLYACVYLSTYHHIMFEFSPLLTIYKYTCTSCHWVETMRKNIDCLTSRHFAPLVHFRERLLAVVWLVGCFYPTKPMNNYYWVHLLGKP